MKYQKRIRDLREDHNLTQEQAGKIINKSQSVYAAYENGKHKLTLDQAIALAEHYKVSIAYIAGETDTPRTPDGQPCKPWKNDIEK